MTTEVIEAPAAIESIDEQIKALRAKKKAIKASQKQYKEPVYNALYKCEGCDCPGLIGRSGMSVRCEAHAKVMSNQSKCNEVKTWQVGGKRKEDSEETLAESLKDTTEQELLDVDEDLTDSTDLEEEEHF